MHARERLAVDGRRLEYRWAGAAAGQASAPPAGDDPVLVFLHDGLGSVSTWLDFPDRLAGATGLAGFVYSRSGYGHSSDATLPRPVTFMHEEARLLPTVCAAAGIRRAILVGHSDGASIALLCAGEPPRDSLRVEALALLAPHVFVEDLTVASIGSLARPRRLEAARDKLREHHADPGRTLAGWTTVWLSAAFRAWNIESCLAGVRVPVLLVQGDRDEFGTLDQIDAIERGVRGPVERRVLPGLGHSPHRDAADATLEALTAFLTRRPGR